jgi:hypothetical protein
MVFKAQKKKSIGCSYYHEVIPDNMYNTYINYKRGFDALRDDFLMVFTAEAGPSI